MKAIAAVSQSWGIGRDNNLLFHIPQDMKFFRSQTADSVVIMGRKTLESFRQAKPLPKRINIVLTRDRAYEKEGAVIVHSAEEALSEAEKYGKKIFVIGGAEIYALFLDRCDQCLITKVEADPEADSFFPNLDRKKDWFLADQGSEAEDGGLKFRFTTYKKR